jgi:hypothetical protein
MGLSVPVGDDAGLALASRHPSADFTATGGRNTLFSLKSCNSHFGDKREWPVVRDFLASV